MFDLATNGPDIVMTEEIRIGEHEFYSMFIAPVGGNDAVIMPITLISMAGMMIILHILTTFVAK